jgi:hypothetical protein
MKINLKKTPEQIELIKAMGSREVSVAREATEAFAAFIGPVINTVLQQAGSASAIYRDLEFDEDDSPSIPLELFSSEEENYITTWSQNIAGGLPTSQVEGMREMKLSTYRLDTAVSFLKKYVRKSRLDVVSKAVERMAQEILIKQERNAWAVILKAVAEARTLNNRHIITSLTESVFNINDISRLMTLIKRIHSSWANGTPTSMDSKGLTDLFVSPEIKQQIRAFAFNAMNTVGAGGNALVSAADTGYQNTQNNGIPLPDAIREKIFSAAGMQEIYGVLLHELNELGLSRRYNTLFSAFSSSMDSNAVFGGNYDATTDDLLVGFDLGRDGFFRPVANQADSNGQFVTFPDDQWVTRSDKTGLFGFIEEGRICVDARAVCAIIV